MEVVTALHEGPLVENPYAAHVRRIAIWLFLVLTCFYILIGGGHIYTPDGVVMFRVSQSLAAGRLDVPELDNWKGFGVCRGLDSPAGEPRFYAKFGLGLSLAAMPLVVIGDGLAALSPESEHDLFEAPLSRDRARWDDWSAENWPVPMEIFAASTVNAFVTAAWVTVLFLVGCELGFPILASLSMALLAGFATPLMHYAQTFFSEPLAGFALLSSFWLVLVARRKNWSAVCLFLAGGALGWVSLTKVALSVLWLPAGIYLLLKMWAGAEIPGCAPGNRLRFLLKRGGSFVAGLVTVLTLLVGYNLARFGTFLETGYGAETGAWDTPLFEGLYGLLVSSGRGLLWYTPLVFVSAVCIRVFVKQYPREAVYGFLSLSSLLLLYARWYMWEGGWCWGPRFLLPIIPILLLPIGAALGSYQRWTAIGRVLFFGAVGVSLFVSISGLLVNYMEFSAWLLQHYVLNSAAYQEAGISDYYGLLRWSWDFSPLVAYWFFPQKDFFMLPRAVVKPGVVLSMYILTGTGLFCSLVMLFRESIRTRRWQQTSGAATG